jgi:methylaspartate mutase S subunit
MITSLYGMAEFDLKGFKAKCVEAGIEDTLLYIGGMLAVGKQNFDEINVKFKEIGFDRVYPPEVDLDLAISDLQEDINKRSIKIKNSNHQRE